MYEFLSYLSYVVENSKLISGLAILILNILSKYVQVTLSKSQEEYIRNTITREILIFITLFVSTRDLKISFLLTAAFLILTSTIFNENSRLCLMPERYKHLQNEIDTNNDGIISDKEIEFARNILNKANIQKSRMNQLNT